MQLSFDYSVFKLEQGAIIEAGHKLVIRYNGTEYPKIIAENPALQLN